MNITKKITRGKLKQFIERHLSDKYTLDIGAGNSPYSHYFPNRVGFDIAAGPGVQVGGDAHTLPFADETFEIVLSTEVLEHLHSPHVAIAEMRRVLKKGGLVLLSTRFIFPIHDAPHDYFRYTEFGLKRLFREWDIVELVAEAGEGETFATLFQRLGFKTLARKTFFSKLLAVCYFITARMIMFAVRVVKKSNDTPTYPESIMTSGYYLVARKR